ncbi:hypothetical protein ERJ75_000362500 [Trypanosoma vivax]|nr:hypothetical protein ERJ75_000362500 [Trypanosoma vivax]
MREARAASLAPRGGTQATRRTCALGRAGGEQGLRRARACTGTRGERRQRRERSGLRERDELSCTERKAADREQGRACGTAFINKAFAFRCAWDRGAGQAKGSGRGRGRGHASAEHKPAVLQPQRYGEQTAEDRRLRDSKTQRGGEGRGAALRGDAVGRAEALSETTGASW